MFFFKSYIGYIYLKCYLNTEIGTHLTWIAILMTGNGQKAQQSSQEHLIPKSMAQYMFLSDLESLDTCEFSLGL